MTRTASRPPWYFVCDFCGAKWFAPQKHSTCLRCQSPSTSREGIVPPWWRQRHADADSASTKPGATTANTPRVPLKANATELTPDQRDTDLHETTEAHTTITTNANP
jgi:hypothetical protein